MVRRTALFHVHQVSIQTIFSTVVYYVISTATLVTSALLIVQAAS